MKDKKAYMTLEMLKLNNIKNKLLKLNNKKTNVSISRRVAHMKDKLVYLLAGGWLT